MDSEDKTNCATNSIQLNLRNNTENKNSYCDGEEVDEMSRRKMSIWMAIKHKIRVGDKGATPLNWKHVFLVFISLFCSAVSLTFLFPFLPEMIVGFGYNEKDKGYYAGLVASAVFAGRAVGSYFWGWLSDRYGRRPIMMITIFGNGFFSLVFGFTYNLPMAIISRFLTGLANGTVGTAKTVLYEICDNTNQALGMSIISVAWGAGIVLGPTAGGLLASPVKRYPQSFTADGIFGKFPYLLPSMIIFIVCVLVDILDFFLLPETLNSKRSTNEKIIDGEEEALTMDMSKPEDRLDAEEDYSQSILSAENVHCESEAATYQREAQTGNLGILRKELQPEFSQDHRRKSLSLCHIPEDRLKHNEHFVTDVAQISKSSHELNKPKTESLDDKFGSVLLTGDVEDPKCDGREQLEGKSSACCSFIKNTNMVTLFRMGDVRQAVMVYTVFSFGVIGFEEIFTVWASTEQRFVSVICSIDLSMIHQHGH